jgi:hypothetical protein
MEFRLYIIKIAKTVKGAEQNSVNKVIKKGDNNTNTSPIETEVNLKGFTISFRLSNQQKFRFWNYG